MTAPALKREKGEVEKKYPEGDVSVLLERLPLENKRLILRAMEMLSEIRPGWMIVDGRLYSA